MKPRLAATALVAASACALALGACTPGDTAQSSSSPAAKGGGDGNYTIAVVPKDATNPWFVRMETGVKKYAEDTGMNAFQKGPAETDATMQALLSDIHGRALIIEPGLGCRQEPGKYALMTNYSLISPESTRKFILPGDDRYERARQRLEACGDLSVSEAFRLLDEVRMEGKWATRVSFVYSAAEQAVYYRCPEKIEKFSFI